MKRVYVWLYLLIIGLLVFRALLNGQELIYYFDFTSMSLVVAPSLFVFLQNRRKQGVIKSVIKASFAGALFGFVLGAFLTLSNTQDMESVLVGLSVAILPLLYATMIGLFLYPLHLLKNK
ncbi:hypothetical protein [Vibrio harveyi]|uniref:hypothetical protein n=1 Tax=Vibrio harveyi TaxID=669 RepID=UPI003CE89DE4